MKYYTHAGLFHADEVFGYAICRMACVCDSLERLTDLNNIPEDGIVADIGRVHDPERHRYDHHQGMLYRENGMPYASAGLLWEQFGLEAIEIYIPSELYADHGFWSEVHARVDHVLIQGLDAHDSDSEYKASFSCSGGDIRGITLPNVVSMYNTKDVNDQGVQNRAFDKASEFAIHILENSIERAVKFCLDQRKFDEVAQIRHDGAVIVLSESLSWKETVHEKHPRARYIIGPSNHPGNPWSMIAVPVSPESRELIMPIERPEWFTGFIHVGKWIAGGESIDQLDELARYCLDIKITTK